MNNDIEESAEALEDLFEDIKLEGKAYEKVATRPSERSEDRRGLVSEPDAYRSIMSIDIVIDIDGTETEKLYKN